MRTAEWINATAFSFLIVLAWVRPLHAPKRYRSSLMGVAGLFLTIVSSAAAPLTLNPLAASVFRDWLPYPLLLLLYWQAGQFFNQPNAGVEGRLQSLDERIVTPLLSWCKPRPGCRWVFTVLEAAYLFCYPALPLGLAALYLLRRGRYADHYWTVVEIATYGCYLLLPFIPTRPPRLIAPPGAAQPPQTPVRQFNLWILRHGSIHANTFPSAHVAASTASALALCQIAPTVGFAFLVLAVLIGLGAALGRYHYAADVILGFLLALVVFLITPTPVSVIP